MAIPCEQPVYWTIQVKNGNAEGTPNLADTDLQVSAGGGAQEVTTDGDGFIHLVFDPEEDLSRVTVSITEEAHGWKGEATPAAGATPRFQSNAVLKGIWKLRVRMKNRSDESSMAEKPILLAWGDSTNDAPRTGGSGGAYRNNDLPCQTTYTISVPADVGATSAASTAQVKVGTDEVDVSAADTPVVHGGTTVTRTADNKVEVTVTQHDTVIVIDFLLQFSWKLQVLVKDRGQAALPVISNAPVHIQEGAVMDDTPRLGAEGEAFEKEGMSLGTDYIVKVPAQYAVGSTAQVKIDNHEVDIGTADTLVDHNGTRVTRNVENEVAVHVERGNTQVEIAFLVQFTWKVRIGVQDVTAKADGTPINGHPVNLKQMPLRFQRAPSQVLDVATEEDGSAFYKDDLIFENIHTFSVPETYGALDATATAEVKVDDHVLDVSVANTFADYGHTRVMRTAANEVQVRVAQGSPEVEINFKLQYPKIFIVGEGPAFPYAIGLARRYAKGEADGDRILAPRAEARALNTWLDDQRKWIIASQYDV
ncbi:MAG TPA: hypothetical protein VKP65_17030, partial [Rhodothermales bacterium]|nr:hypothetical protein [Rhodothermales bacterium]